MKCFHLAIATNPYFAKKNIHINITRFFFIFLICTLELGYTQYFRLALEKIVFFLEYFLITITDDIQ